MITGPTTRVSFDRSGMPECMVTFPCAADERMREYAADIAHAAIVTALMREDGAHPRERSDYETGTAVRIESVRDTRVLVRAL